MTPRPGAAQDPQAALLDGKSDEEVLDLLGPADDRTRRPAPSHGAPVLVSLAEVEPQRVEWLWPGRIPLGKLTVLEGDPGLGKSTLTLDLAARVSRGTTMPDGTLGVLGGVVILTAEDGLGDTVRPRLEAARANLTQIVALTGVCMDDAQGFERMPTLPEDLPALEAAVREVGARLIIVDPLFAYLGSATDSYKDADIRRALAPLAELAARTGAAVLVIRHWTKAQGRAIVRGQGSIGVTAAARSVMLVARDPDDPDENGRRVLAAVKNNLAPVPNSLTYIIEPVGFTTRIAWGGASPHRADTLAAVPDDEEGSASEDARAFLQDALRLAPVAAGKLQAAAKQAGLSWSTVRRAKDSLGVVSEKQGFGESGEWLWRLPTATQAPKVLTPIHTGMSALGEDEHLRPVPTTYAPLQALKDAKVLTLPNAPGVSTLGRVQPCAHSAPREPWTDADGWVHCGVCHPDPRRPGAA